MSYDLAHSGNLNAKAWRTRVDIGRYSIDMRDFAFLVEYVMENDALGGDEDPRRVLLERLKLMTVADDGHFRLPGEIPFNPYYELPVGDPEEVFPWTRMSSEPATEGAE